jgi:hypothetical protein
MISCSKPFALQLDKGFESVGQENAFVQGAGSQSNREGGVGGYLRPCLYVIQAQKCTVNFYRLSPGIYRIQLVYKNNVIF